MTSTPRELEHALGLLAALGAGSDLAIRISAIEQRLAGARLDRVSSMLADEEISDAVLSAALLVKDLAGQIHVIVHAVGILVALPHILEDGEEIQSVSLGAGNSGRSHDLETTRRLAEFKFIEWRGGAESIRQNSLFVDLFNLASVATEKRRVLYVLGKEMPVKFLQNRRAITSVLSKDAAAAARFRKLHGGSFRTVAEYYKTVRHTVEIVDLREVVPALRRGPAIA